MALQCDITHRITCFQTHSSASAFSLFSLSSLRRGLYSRRRHRHYHNQTSVVFTRLVHTIHWHAYLYISPILHWANYFSNACLRIFGLFAGTCFLDSWDSTPFYCVRFVTWAARISIFPTFPRVNVDDNYDLSCLIFSWSSTFQPSLFFYLPTYTSKRWACFF